MFDPQKSIDILSYLCDLIESTKRAIDQQRVFILLVSNSQIQACFTSLDDEDQLFEPETYKFELSNHLEEDCRLYILETLQDSMRQKQLLIDSLEAEFKKIKTNLDSQKEGIKS